MFHRPIVSAIAFAVAFSGTVPASAAVLAGPFTGNFSADDDVVLIALTFEAAGTYRFESFSYAGGTLSDGSVIEAGGFDVVLSLFDADGTLLGNNDDGSARTDPASESSFDAVVELALDAGDYTLAVTQFDNFAVGTLLGDGFERDGQGNFTPALAEGKCSAASFCDISGVAPFNARTSFYAVDVTLVPVPPALLLLAPALAGIAGFRRRDGGAPAPR